MKKKIVCTLLSICLLGGCGPKSISETTATSTTDAETKLTESEGLSETNSSESVYPETNFKGNSFNQLTQDQQNNLPDIELLEQKINDALTSIGVTDSSNALWGNFDDELDILSIEVWVTTGTGKKLSVSSMYISQSSDPEWTVNSISDIETGKTYYMEESIKSVADIYDYNTGQLISGKEETYEEWQKRADQIHEENMDQFESSLEEIQEKYGIKK